MDDSIQSLAANNSLVQSFDIEGLYGYRNIGMSSNFAATVLIAKNGSGKTTLLSAMDAFLRRQFVRLNELEFKSIKCKLRGIEEPLVLTKDDLNDLTRASTDKEFSAKARRFGLEEIDLFNFLEGEFSSSNFISKMNGSGKVFSTLVRSHGYSTRDAVEFCHKLRESYYCSTPNLARHWAVLESVFKDVEIMYLPTYRRIELPIHDDAELESANGRRQPSLPFPKHGLFSGNIQFGLGDIPEKLRELNQSMLIESNVSYRQISANIINELLDGTFEKHSSEHGYLPDRDELQLFFSRLKDARHIGPYQDTLIFDIDRIYSREADTESNKFLFYFLGKLNVAIQSTKTTESLVESFVENCNRYLSSQDPSTYVSGGADPDDRTEGKRLRLNRRNLSIMVESLPFKRKIKLDALSSGEKQMISLFAKMYLYDKKKLVLIDEPELSLSIGWQREILKDILKAPNCSQVIAITHSPFVFDNELERYARSLKSVVTAELSPELFTEGTEGFTEDESNDSLF